MADELVNYVITHPLTKDTVAAANKHSELNEFQFSQSI